MAVSLVLTLSHQQPLLCLAIKVIIILCSLTRVEHSHWYFSNMKLGAVGAVVWSMWAKWNSHFIWGWESTMAAQWQSRTGKASSYKDAVCLESEWHRFRGNSLGLNGQILGYEPLIYLNLYNCNVFWCLLKERRDAQVLPLKSLRRYPKERTSWHTKTFGLDILTLNWAACLETQTRVLSMYRLEIMDKLLCEGKATVSFE